MISPGSHLEPPWIRPAGKLGSVSRRSSSHPPLDVPVVLPGECLPGMTSPGNVGNGCPGAGPMKCGGVPEFGRGNVGVPANDGCPGKDSMRAMKLRGVSGDWVRECGCPGEGMDVPGKGWVSRGRDPGEGKEWGWRVWESERPAGEARTESGRPDPANSELSGIIACAPQCDNAPHRLRGSAAVGSQRSLGERTR